MNFQNIFQSQPPIRSGYHLDQELQKMIIYLSHQVSGGKQLSRGRQESY